MKQTFGASDCRQLSILFFLPVVVLSFYPLAVVNNTGWSFRKSVSYCYGIRTSGTAHGQRRTVVKFGQGKSSQVFALHSWLQLLMITLYTHIPGQAGCMYQILPLKQKNESKQDGIKQNKKICLEEINPCSCIIHLRETVSHRLHPYISLMDQIQN